VSARGLPALSPTGLRRNDRSESSSTRGGSLRRDQIGLGDDSGFVTRERSSACVPARCCRGRPPSEMPRVARVRSLDPRRSPRSPGRQGIRPRGRRANDRVRGGKGSSGCQRAGASMVGRCTLALQTVRRIVRSRRQTRHYVGNTACGAIWSRSARGDVGPRSRCSSAA
jgi:hypothetical protein